MEERFFSVKTPLFFFDRELAASLSVFSEALAFPFLFSRKFL